MSDFFSYLVSFWANWIPLVSTGAFLGLDEAAKRLSPRAKTFLNQIPQDKRRKIGFIFIFLAAFYASFTAWRGQHTGYLREHDARVTAETALSDYQKNSADISAPSRAERDPNALYQYDQEIGDIQGAVVSQSQSLVTFQMAHTNGKEDPTKPVEYQNWRLSCPGLPAIPPNEFVGTFSGMADGIKCTIIGNLN